MTPTPDPIEIKAVISRILADVNHKQIAAHLGICESDLSRRFSEHCPRKCGIGEGLRELFAVSRVAPKEFEALRAYITSRLDEWARPEINGDLPSSAGELAQENAEFLCTVLEGKSPATQTKELLDVVVAANRIVPLLSGRKANEVSVGRKMQTRMRRAG